MNLSLQYFAVYLFLFVFITIHQFSGGKAGAWGCSVMEACQKTVMFAPMLSVLFLAVRMRALQPTKANDGTIPVTAGPQLWAQEAMFLATWSVLVQLLVTLIVGLISGGAPKMDKDGNAKAPERLQKWGVTGRIL